MKNQVKTRHFGDYTEKEIQEIQVLINSVCDRLSELHINWDEYKKGVSLIFCKDKFSDTLIYETNESYAAITRLKSPLGNDLTYSRKCKIFDESEVFRLSLDNDSVFCDFIDRDLSESFKRIWTTQSHISFLKASYSMINRKTLSKINET